MEVIDTGNGHVNEVLIDIESFNLIVRTDNVAPVLLPIGNLSVAETETLAFAMSAFDADGDTLTYRGDNLPAGAVVDPMSGVLTWTPNIFQAGSYPNVTLSVSDGHGDRQRSHHAHGR